MCFCFCEEYLREFSSYYVKDAKGKLTETVKKHFEGWM